MNKCPLSHLKCYIYYGPSDQSFKLIVGSTTCRTNKLTLN